MTEIFTKKVLIIAYYFPPMGMGGVQRVAKFVKYLPQFGWQPVVLTLKDVEYLSSDPSLMEEIPENVEVFRTGSLDPLRILFLIRKFFKRKKKGKAKSYTEGKSKFLSWFLFPDNKIGWLPWALAKGYFLCKREKINLIFSTSPPITSHLIGYLLSLLTGIKWVSDYRDLWSGGYQYEYPPTPIHIWLKNRIQKTLLKKADGVTAVNDILLQKLKEIENRIGKSELILSGFDSEDFQLTPKSRSDLFTVVYMGTFSPDHNPQPFLAALSGLLEENLIPKNKIKFNHIGLCAGIDMDKLLTKYDLENIVEQKGYLPHKQAVEFLSQADLFLLAITPRKQGEIILTGKIFEYMAAQKPILAVVPPKGAAAQIIKEFNAGKVVSPDNIPEIKEALFYFYQKFDKKEKVAELKVEDLKFLERRYLTSKLAKLFELVLQKH